jgi:four helix bundle protein
LVSWLVGWLVGWLTGRENGDNKRFEEMLCWQAARNLVNLVYNLTKNERFKRDYDLVNQIRRSAVSTMANMAEGFHRSSNKDFVKFLDYSRASVAETVSHGYVAYDQDYITESDLKELHRQADVVWKSTNGFMAYLKRNTKKEPRN